MATRVFYKSAGFAFLLGLILMGTACNKDDNDMPSQKTITETVVDDDNFSLLETAVVRAGLADFLSTTNNLTVFAPTNQAFEDAGLTASVISSMDPTALGNVLKYHVLTTSVSSSAVPAGPNAAVATANTADIYLTKSGSSVYVNGSTVTTADVMAKNGVIHVIDHVLMPPAGNIVETAQGNSDLSYLVAAVLRADASGTSVSGALSGTDALTVFAPTNDAFMQAGFNSVADIQAADPATLRDILLYHVVASRVFSTDLTDDSNVTTVGGGDLSIDLTGGATVTGAGNTSASNISKANIVAENGVIHVIDRVLLPS